MSEIAENAFVQESSQKNKRKRRIVIFCIVSLLNVGLLALILTQLLTPATHSVTDPLVGHPAPNFTLVLLHSEFWQECTLALKSQGKTDCVEFLGFMVSTM